MPRQLTGLDASFLERERAGVHGHVTAVQVFDCSTAPDGVLSAAAVRALVRDRVRLTPLQHLRLERELPLVGRRFWAHGPAVDPDAHVREVMCDPPGDDQALARVAARIHGQRMDLTRPPWDITVVSGLAEGRGALVSRVHHALGDGLAQAATIGVLFDLAADGAGPNRDAVPAAWPLDPPLDRSDAVRDLARRPGRKARAIARAREHVDQVPGLRGLPGAQRISGRRDWVQAPDSPFNGPVGHARSVAFCVLALDEVKAVKNAMGVTVNDVVVAICTGALRRLLVQRGALPTAPLVAVVPVSTRGPGDPPHGNRVQFPVAPIPTDAADPLTRLARTAASMSQLKARAADMPPELLSDAATALSPRTAAALHRLTGAHAGANVMISNVPFPPFEVYVAGARLLSHHPISHLLDGIGLTMCVTSTSDRINVGLCGDAGLVPDLADLAGHVTAELAVLSRLAVAQSAPTLRV